MNKYVIILCIVTAVIVTANAEVGYSSDEEDCAFPQTLMHSFVIGGRELKCTCRMLRGVCTREMNPVCDSNGNTHSNFCMFCFQVGNNYKKFVEDGTPMPEVHVARMGRC